MNKYESVVYIYWLYLLAFTIVAVTQCDNELEYYSALFKFIYCVTNNCDPHVFKIYTAGIINPLANTIRGIECKVI